MSFTIDFGTHFLWVLGTPVMFVLCMEEQVLPVHHIPECLPVYRQFSVPLVVMVKLGWVIHFLFIDSLRGSFSLMEDEKIVQVLVESPPFSSFPV